MDAQGPVVTNEAVDLDDIWNPKVVFSSSDQKSNEERQRKRRRTTDAGQNFLVDFPRTKRYTKSFMHRDNLLFVEFSASKQFLMSCSIDGHLKFWKKKGRGIDFVKTFRVALHGVIDKSLSADGELFAVASANQQPGSTSIKIFDVALLDMIHMLNLDFDALAICFAHSYDSSQKLLAVSDRNIPKVVVLDIAADDSVHCTIDKLFRTPVKLMQFNSAFESIIGIDSVGMLECFSADGEDQQSKQSFTLKSQTDLYAFKKARCQPICLSVSSDGQRFAIFSFPDRFVRIFDFDTGKLTHVFDESLDIANERAGEYELNEIDRLELGKLLANERDFENVAAAQGLHRFFSIEFDETCQFILYPTLAGIKLVDLNTSKCVRMYGAQESLKFVSLALHQNAFSTQHKMSTALAASSNPLVLQSRAIDPTLFATAYKKARFYLFTSHSFEQEQAERDVVNELVQKDKATPAKDDNGLERAASAIIHTTMGDIRLELYPEDAPKTVKNFVTLARRNLYNACTFHRVIKKFMIQTGDFDGAGGQSIYGSSFEDEISEKKHDKPFVLSMANAGPNTNGSQFFITTDPTPWLDGKHTIFGRVTDGFDVVRKIEDAETDTYDCPVDAIKILNIDIAN